MGEVVHLQFLVVGRQTHFGGSEVVHSFSRNAYSTNIEQKHDYRAHPHKSASLIIF